MPPKSAILLAVAVFLLTVLVRLPARVLPWLLPREVHCQSPAGTLWRGVCGELSSGELVLSGVRWSLHPLSLLRAHLDLAVQSEDARAAGQAELTLYPDRQIEVRDLQASLPLQGGLTPFPAAWSGTLGLAVAQARIRSGHLVALQGVITAAHLRSDHPAQELGSLALEFPLASAGAPMIGTLHDLDGPLSLRGRLQLSAAGSYELDGTVAMRDASNAGLQQMLQLLGPADAQGRYAFSVAGTL
jgi:hypothetical protein